MGWSPPGKELGWLCMDGVWESLALPGVLHLPEFSSWEGSGERLLLAIASQNVSSW